MLNKFCPKAAGFLIAFIFCLIAHPAPLLSITAKPLKKEHDFAHICRDAVAAAEQKHRIPAQLLSAISLTESGKWVAETAEMVAWPWTLNVQGKGQYFPTKADALRVLQELRRQGLRNIDVGCMQINMGYHGDAFDSLEQALEPAHNVAYSASLLKHHRAKTKSWSQAVRYYHSKNPAHHVGYYKRVMKRWQEERQRVITAEIEANRAAHEARRAQRRAAQTAQTAQAVSKNRSLNPAVKKAE